MTGREMMPKVTTVAPTMPVVAPSNAPTTITAIAKEPRRRPQILPMYSISSVAKPERFNTSPMNMNRGTASRVKLFMKPHTRSGIREKTSRLPVNNNANTMATKPKVKATG